MSKKKKNKAPPVAVVEEKAMKARTAPKKKGSRAPEQGQEQALEPAQVLVEEFQEVRPKG